MKAMRLKKPGGLENIFVGSADTRAPAPGEISVQLHASSLNFHDYLVVKGMIPVEEDRIPMSDGAGVVTAVGAGVAEFAVGDKVVSTFFPDWLGGEASIELMGGVPGDRGEGYAREAVTASAKSFTKAPKGYSHAEAATLTCAGLTAWRALEVVGNIKSGDVVLTQGTGGVSIFALQFAKAAGATVISTTSNADKAARLKTLGADHVINYKDDVEWGRTAKKLTGGRGVDHVVEIGGAGTIEQSMRASRLGGHISLIGVLAGYAGSINTALLMSMQIRLIGITVGARQHQQDMIRAIDANGIKPVLDQSFALDKLADAFRRQESGQHFGKIVVEW
ncbi:MAG: NAD(P)-dependent alcohol dehydrogenase [Hyphomonadaceae bacterium]